MGEVRVKVKLQNEGDVFLHKYHKLPQGKIRHAEIDALVDTGAVMVLLPRDLVEKLGLEIFDKRIVLLANDEKVTMDFAKSISLYVGDRGMTTDCLVGPPLCEPLIGQIVLEALDLIVDPVKKTITPRPESPYLPTLKMK